MNKTNPIFLVGMQRSGTSLIRAALSKHSNIGIPPKGELQFFATWFNKYGSISDTNNFKSFANAFFEKSKFKYLDISSENVLKRFEDKDVSYIDFFTSVMEEYAHHHNKRRWGEKSTTHIEHLPTILQNYPNAKYILIVRDPRDTYLSYKNWDKRNTNIGLKQWVLSWHYNYFNALKVFFNHQTQFYLYKHELFVSNPSVELKKILDFLQETFESECLDISNVKWEQNSSYGDSSSQINSNSVGRWQDQILADELYYIEKHCKDLMFLLNYEPSKISKDILSRCSTLVRDFKNLTSNLSR